MCPHETMIALRQKASRRCRLPRPSLAHRAQEALERSPIFKGRSRHIRLDERNGHLVVQGRLPSFYLKQMLQTVLRQVEGVERIDNRVMVDWPVRNMDESSEP